MGKNGKKGKMMKSFFKRAQEDVKEFKKKYDKGRLGYIYGASDYPKEVEAMELIEKTLKTIPDPTKDGELTKEHIELLQDSYFQALSLLSEMNSEEHLGILQKIVTTTICSAVFKGSFSWSNDDGISVSLSPAVDQLVEKIARLMESTDKLDEKISVFEEKTTNISGDFTEITSSLDTVKETLSNYTEKLPKLETSLENLENKLETLETKIDSLSTSWLSQMKEFACENKLLTMAVVGSALVLAIAGGYVIYNYARDKGRNERAKIRTTDQEDTEDIRDRNIENGGGDTFGAFN